jgi:undecaprenyl-diphosphatase
LVVTLADQTSVHLFKNVFERLRPCHNPEIRELIHLAASKCYGKFGFVSSHAANSFGVAVFLALAFKTRWFSWFILAWALLVSYSRIYLGVHYPADIIVGGLLGAVCGYAVWNLLYGFNKTYGILKKR